MFFENTKLGLTDIQLSQRFINFSKEQFGVENNFVRLLYFTKILAG